MGSGTFYVAAGSDDGQFDHSSGLWVSNSSIVVGQLEHSGFIRFSAVTIPQRAIISSASIRFISGWSDSGGCAWTFYGNDVDNAVAPTNHTEAVNLAKTEASVEWTLSAWVEGTKYTSPDLSAIIQEIVNRTNWASGNALQIIIDSTSTYKRSFQAYECTDETDRPTLSVAWDPAQATVDVCTWNPDDKGDNISLDDTLLIATHT
ncbi:MAG: hypothetical protein JRI80_04890 [Deltaproteobacteria bacterium]|nr:hypothetical protein [Deltaproteobacteria bacterium]